MLRVGLTGGLGSGKSTVAAMLAAMGARVFSADEIARGLMQPGEAVYTAIVERFGRDVVLADGRLDRRELARLAFAEGLVEELNAIVHPATIARQEEMTTDVLAQDERAIVVVESALVFETPYGRRSGGGWRDRFDRVVLVTAPEELKVTRFVTRTGSGERAALEEEARRRLAKMIPDEKKAAEADYVIANDGTVAELRLRATELWEKLLQVEEKLSDGETRGYRRR